MGTEPTRPTEPTEFTEPTESATIRVVGVVVAAALLLVGLLHLVWTTSTWPLAGREDFARLVVGVPVDRLPSAGLTAVVAGLLLAAAYLVGAAAGVWPGVGPRWMVRVGVAVVAGVLLVRGGGGFGADLYTPSYAPADFVRLDRILYSPLCLALGLGSGWVLLRGRRLTP
jgi:hypothetical protein